MNILDVELRSDLQWSMEKDLKGVSRDGSLFVNTGQSNIHISTDKPIPRDVIKYYFEITICDLGVQGNVMIGLIKKSPTRVSQEFTMSGKSPNLYVEAGTIIYSGKTGYIYYNARKRGSKKDSRNEFKQGDTVGCLVVRREKGPNSASYCYFTKNGQYLDVAIEMDKENYYPAFKMWSNDTAVDANLGERERDFLTDISGNVR